MFKKQTTEIIGCLELPFTPLPEHYSLWSQGNLKIIKQVDVLANTKSRTLKVRDAFPLDETETLDSDEDGVGNNADAFPNDASETVDSDDDGIGDNSDPFPNNAGETTDTDNDGIGNNTDNCPSVANPSQEDADSNGVGDACPPELAQAKLLVSEARTWVASINDLSTPIQAFAITAEPLSNTLNNSTNALLELTGIVMDQVSTAIDNTQQTSESTITLPSSVDIKNGTGTSIGTVTHTKQSSSSSFGFNVMGNIAGVDINLTPEIDKSEGQIIAAIIASDNDSFDPSGESYEIDLNGSVTDPQSEKIEFSNIRLNIALAENDPAPSSVSLQGAVAITALANDAPTGDKLSSEIDIQLVALAPENTVNPEGSGLSLKRLKLTDATITDTQGSTAGLTIDLNISNAATFDTFAFLDGDSELYINYGSIQGGAAAFGAVATSNSIALEDLDEVCYGPQCFGYSNPIPDNQTCVRGISSSGMDSPVQVNTCEVGDTANVRTIIAQGYPSGSTVEIHQAVYHQHSEEGFVAHWNGRVFLPDLESADNFLKGTLSVAGTLSLAGQPTAIVTVTVDRTGLESGTGNINIAYDDRSLNISVSSETATLTITNDSNAVLVISPSADQLGGNVSVNGHQVGVVSKGAGGTAIITYIDGTFENL